MMTIRREQLADKEAIRRINEEAFGQPAEADLVNRMRVRQAIFISLVACKNFSPIGHIVFSPLLTDSGKPLSGGAALGPMAVLPASQLHRYCARDN